MINYIYNIIFNNEYINYSTTIFKKFHSLMPHSHTFRILNIIFLIKFSYFHFQNIKIRGHNNKLIVNIITERRQYLTILGFDYQTNTLCLIPNL